jgi:hypothetical protein
MSSIAPGSVPIVFARLRRSPWSAVGRSGPLWARRNSSAGTTRISRPSPSRIVTGATLSSSAAALRSADFILPLETRLSGAWVRPPPCGKVMSQAGVSWRLKMWRSCSCSTRSVKFVDARMPGVRCRHFHSAAATRPPTSSIPCSPRRSPRRRPSTSPCGPCPSPKLRPAPSD